MDGGAAHADGCGFRCRDGTRDRGWPRTATGSLNLAKRIASFGQGLSETSYVAGRDVMIEPRLAEGQYERMSVTSGMLRSSAIWQSGSILIMPLDKASRRLSETRSSRKSGTRLSASMKESRPPASRREDDLQRPDWSSPLRACRDAPSATGRFLRPAPG